MSNIANFVTFLSLFCGFFSIVFSLEGHFTFACWAIICSVVFDGLDGKVARFISKSSPLGKELDSLVDVICFGLAPAILGYIFVYRNFFIWAFVSLFIYLSCSVMRLAIYNIISGQRHNNYFLGLPTTASGGVLASFILIYRRYADAPAPVTFLFLVVILSVLMVSRIKYPNLSAIRKMTDNYVRPIAAVLIVIFLFLIWFYLRFTVFPAEVIIFVIFSGYLIFSPFLYKKFV